MQIFAPLTSEAFPILQKIEVATSLQIPSFQIIGLPSQEIAEARERVRAAIEASQLDFPKRRVVINLSPASIRKRGTGLDFPIALAVLASAHPKNQSTPLLLGETVAWGELGLDGGLRSVGQLMRALYAAWGASSKRMLLCARELDTAKNCLDLLAATGDFKTAPPELFGFESLQQAWEWVSAPRATYPPIASISGEKCEVFPAQIFSTPSPALLPLSAGLERLIGVAATGNHHLLILGPRGAGKSHALEWLVALQPPAAAATRVHHALIHELRDPFPKAQATGPVRRISPQAKPAALIGTASPWAIKPGEFSLAHGGLLLADELPEWARDSRESFREPLERGKVLLTRVNGVFELPARFVLAANGNLCPCGGWPLAHDGLSSLPALACHCTETARRNYLSRLSGPLLDRLDLVVLMTEKLGAPPKEESVRAVRERFKGLLEHTIRARELCVKTWGQLPGETEAGKFGALLTESPAWRTSLECANAISLRSRHKILRVAMTLSAWDATAPNHPDIGMASALGPARDSLATPFLGPEPRHFLEAHCYRPEASGLS